MDKRYSAGLAFALTANIIWGSFPLYWALLPGVEALEILAHRIIWTLPFAAVMVSVGRQWRLVARVLRTPRQLALLTLTACLIALNWGLYIWSVTHGRVVEASLGYYLTPLVTVLLGVIAFGERPRRLQWLAVGFAVAGVAMLVIGVGHLPWVALTLATSFGLYGALRKRAVADSAAGLFLETAVLAPVALSGVLWLLLGGGGAFLHGGARTDLLLVGAGVMTAVPLLTYVAGARRLPMMTLGILFYVNPTLQLLLGVLVFEEALTRGQIVSFVLIWLGIAVYLLDGILRRRPLAIEQPPQPAAPHQ